MRKLTVMVLLLAMIMSLVCLSACGNDTPDEPQTPDAPSTPEQPDVPDEETPPEQDRLPLDLPAGLYYGGDQPFHILQWSANGAVEVGESGWIPWEEGAVEEYTDNIMEQAVFSRNAWVEEQLGVKITAEYVSVDQGYQTRLQQDYATTANEFQLATVRSRTVWPIIEAGLYADMNEFEGTILHTDQPWWPADAVASYRLGNSLYACATEMLVRDKAATAGIFFNTQIANDHGITALYDWVEMGDWTLEMMISCCEVTATSLDGDGMINSAQDLWGVEGGESSYLFFIGGGYKFAHVGDEGYIAYDFGSPETILAMQAIYEDYMYAEWNYKNHTPLEGQPEGGMFPNGRSLFFVGLVKNAYMSFRDMETEYGILPIPMYESGQDSYYSMVHSHHDSVVGIPAGSVDRELSAVVLEMLSYEGYYTVTPVLYETMMLSRLAKSEESKRSMEIIFATRTYDPGQYWDSETKLHGAFFRLSNTGNSNIAGIWKTWENATNEQMDMINNFIKESMEK